MKLKTMNNVAVLQSHQKIKKCKILSQAEV